MVANACTPSSATRDGPDVARRMVPHRQADDRAWLRYRKVHRQDDTGFQPNRLRLPKQPKGKGKNQRTSDEPVVDEVRMRPPRTCRHIIGTGSGEGPLRGNQTIAAFRLSLRAWTEMSVTRRKRGPHWPLGQRKSDPIFKAQWALDGNIQRPFGLGLLYPPVPHTIEKPAIRL